MPEAAVPGSGGKAANDEFVAARERPRREYARRLAGREAAVDGWSRADRRLSAARFLTLVLATVLAWLAFGRALLPAASLFLPVVVFVALMIFHERVVVRLARAERSVRIYRRGLARLDDAWAGGGSDGARFLDPVHPYAGDLDLFGKGSLFELLCTARTEAGEETLAAWLLRPAAADEVRARQAAVTELSGRLDLREDLALIGSEVRAGLDPGKISAWAAAAVALPRWLRPAALGLVFATVLALLAWPLGAGPLPVLLALLGEAALAAFVSTRIEHVVARVREPARGLELFAGLLARFEQESFASERLITAQAALRVAGRAPSAQVATLARLVVLLDSRDNQMFLPFSKLLMWSTLIGISIERWRQQCGPALGEWFRAAGELEALCALGGYAYENPSDCFPEVSGPGPVFAGRGLRHPLLPIGLAVANDVELNSDRRLLLISGSNMSGKSTLLRTVGVNAVLAFAGAPVRARGLRLSPLAIGASINIHDSLQDGTSKFYAEIKRLRQIVDLAQGPLLFLLDEILHGTNSHDRRIGAEAVVRELLDRGALGLVTTHDLALAAIASDAQLRAANTHFEDHIVAGRMSFDYRMRPGVVEKSNALELMRAVGLDV